MRSKSVTAPRTRPRDQNRTQQNTYRTLYRRSHKRIPIRSNQNACVLRLLQNTLTCAKSVTFMRSKMRSKVKHLG